MADCKTLPQLVKGCAEYVHILHSPAIIAFDAYLDGDMVHMFRTKQDQFLLQKCLAEDPLGVRK